MQASNAALYGKGIFTTVAIYGRKPFLWEKHWRRLVANAAKIGIDLSEYSEDKIRNRLNEAVAEDLLIDGRARITFFDRSPSSIWSSDPARQTSLEIITGGPKLKPANFNLTVSPYTVNSRSPLTGIKSCSYLENLLAFENAKANGFDEALRFNERGEVTSACMANVFWLRDGNLYTPSLKTGSLAGTTREFVLEKLQCVEVEVGVEQLEKAESIFLTSAGLGIAAVGGFDGRTLASLPLNINDLIH